MKVIKVEIDKFQCGNCGKIYDHVNDAEACEEKCGCDHKFKYHIHDYCSTIIVRRCEKCDHYKNYDVSLPPFRDNIKQFYDLAEKITNELYK